MGICIECQNCRKHLPFTGLPLLDAAPFSCKDCGGLYGSEEENLTCNDEVFVFRNGMLETAAGIQGFYRIPLGEPLSETEPVCICVAGRSRFCEAHSRKT